MTNFPQFKKLSIYDDYEPSKVSNSTGTIPNNHYHKKIGKTMTKMTTERAIEVLKKSKQRFDDNKDLWETKPEFIQALDKAIEVMEVTQSVANFTSKMTDNINREAMNKYRKRGNEL